MLSGQTLLQGPPSWGLGLYKSDVFERFAVTAGARTIPLHPSPHAVLQSTARDHRLCLPIRGFMLVPMLFETIKLELFKRYDG